MSYARAGGAAELAHLAESLPLATALSHPLEDTVEIDDDAFELLVPALAAPGHAIRAVELSGTMATEARRGTDRRLLPGAARRGRRTASDGRVYYRQAERQDVVDRPAGGVGGKTPRADKGDYDHLFVVMVAGERGAGKTALIRRFVEGKGRRPHGKADGGGVRQGLWHGDGASRAGRWLQVCTGRRRARAKRRVGAVYFRSVHGALVVYDAGDRASFRAAPAGCGRCGATRGSTPPPPSSPPRATRRGTGR